jgi:hypothetical protein
LTEQAFTNCVRDRVRHYLEPSFLAQCGLSLDQAQRFIGGTYLPDNSQLVALALRMKLPIPQAALDAWRLNRNRRAA